MNVNSVELTNFMGHRSAVLDLPQNGVVVITGDNGTGKSSFIEAVGWAVWGRTLRGTKPDRGKVAPLVKLNTGSLRIERDAKALKWNPHGMEPTKYDTKTEAAKALHSLVGTHAVWRRTSVFSSSDASEFTTASDGDRKRFVERLVGLERFDVGLASCREDIRQLDAAIDKLRREAAVLAARIEGAQAQASTAQRSVAAPVRDVATIEAELGQARPASEALRVQAQTAQEGLRDARSEQSVLRERARSAQARHNATSGAGQCSQCGQDVTAKVIEALAAQARTATDAASAHEAVVAQCDAQVRHTHGQWVQADGVVHRLGADLAAAQQAAHNRASWADALATAQQQIDELSAEVAAKTAALEALLHERKVLGVCENVLGLRGLRTRLIGQVLTQVEAQANMYLGRMGKQRVKLRTYTQQASGKVVPSLSLELEGAGGGRGYKAASGGERRRVDAALLLAFADVSASLFGVAHNGTLWLDEVFDALDPAGVDAISGIVEDLAARRAVVVITHNQRLAERLVAAKRVRL